MQFKDVFVKAACHFIRGGTIEMIGNPLKDFQNKVTSLKAVISPNSIKGSIVCTLIVMETLQQI